MDQAGVDAVVYPGLLAISPSMMAGGNRASFGRRDTPSAANGIPTVVFPGGVRQRGTADQYQLLVAHGTMTSCRHGVCVRGIANVAGHGHVEATTAPALPHGKAGHNKIWLESGETTKPDPGLAFHQI